jgi:HAD superfamily hydrolase (TIGR01509 family)
MEPAGGETERVHPASVPEAPRYTGPGVTTLRAVFFDAGNTLMRMDYAAIAAEVSRHGAPVTAEAVQRAEWRARVRLDDHIFARTAAAESTESTATATLYLRYTLEGLGVTDPMIVEKVTAWRRTYNPPAGVWTARDPQALEALALVRRAGLRAAAISNSDGTVRSLLDAVGVVAHLDFVVDSGEVGVEKPDPRIFELALARAGVAAAEAAYIGDLYTIDARGAGAAGLRVVLLDPGGFWGARDCEMAPDLLSAVRLLVG